MSFVSKVVVVGGCGHVGLPLSAVLAEAGMSVVAFDTNQSSVDIVNKKMAPFLEPGLDQLLNLVVPFNLVASTSPKSIKDSDIVIMIVGTPLDVHLNPDPNCVVKAVEDIIDVLVDGQLLILRSTVFPGVTKRVEALLEAHEKKIEVAFCPERIAEGYALQELKVLPQIIGVRNNNLFKKVQNLFHQVGIKSIRTTPEEAEFAKLFTNTWRYIKFAAANQFWMLANSANVDFEKISSAMKFEYPRATDFPGAGFAAGPCLFKDAMQLAAFSGHNFPLGQAAMQINESQPNFILSKLSESYNLSEMTIGILGMAFKGDSDDPRSSLAYKLKKFLTFSAKKVLTADPFVRSDKELISQEELLRYSDLVVIGAPHSCYRELEINVPVVDMWNLRKNGSNIVS